MTSFMCASELLLAEVAMRVREIAIEAKSRVLHQRVEPVMHPLDRLAPRRDLLEGLLQLSKVFRLDDDVEFADAGRAEAELASCEPPVLDQALGFQMAQILSGGLDECGIPHARLEVAPDGIEVHAAPARWADQHGKRNCATNKRCRSRGSPARMNHAFFGSGISPGAPAFFHPPK